MRSAIQIKLKNILLISAFVLNPLASFAQGTSSACITYLTNPTSSSYKPVGFVTHTMIDKFTRKHPLLFTQVYFRALGHALSQNGFQNIANTKGVFYETITDSDKKRLTDVLSGTAERSIQLQGAIATSTWNYLVEKFKLDAAEIPDDEIEINSKKAFFNSPDQYVATRKSLLENIEQKKQIAELIRLSLPFGARLAVDGATRSTRSALFMTSLAGVTTAAVTYGAAQVAMMSGVSDPGIIPLAAAGAATAASGFLTYFFTAPRTHLGRLQLWLMNSSNRRALKKAGLISEKDGDADLFIDSEFADLGVLQTRVELAMITAALPMIPISTKSDDVQKSLFVYGNQLQQYMALSDAFRSQVMIDWNKRTRAMGEPIYTLGRILSMDKNKARYEIPENVHDAINTYRSQLPDVFNKLIEVKGELEAISLQFGIHVQVLESYLQANSQHLDQESANDINKKLLDLRSGKATAETLVNVTITQLEQLKEEQTVLGTAIEAIVAARANNTLNPSQFEKLSSATQSLMDHLQKVEAEIEPLPQQGITNQSTSEMVNER
ncbi:MAG: hypothetical protein KDD38_00765 [Bdellovibrionales bacterium]|nr:hypothetical protein [Bdellovibrionales bacterium]